jgi:uncharacterized protein YdaU (DUF1376 family)
MAKTDIWMPLYIADYLADTMRLTTEQHGAYLLLIMDYWRNGSLPDDDETLSSITKLQLSTWRKYRPVFTKLFMVGNGEWRHKRIDQELLKATENSSKYEQRARKAAQKRWEKEEEFTSSSNAYSDASSMPEEVLGQCTSHTPSPSTVNLNHGYKHTPLETPVCDFTPTPVGLCCKAMIQQGIKNTSQQNPTFLALINAGATEQEFANAAKAAVSKGKPDFAYAIGIVKKQREDAAKLILHRGPLPTKQESLEQENKEATQRAKARLFGLQTEKDITNEATRL